MICDTGHAHAALTAVRFKKVYGYALFLCQSVNFWDSHAPIRNQHAAVTLFSLEMQWWHVFLKNNIRSHPHAPVARGVIGYRRSSRRRCPICRCPARHLSTCRTYYVDSFWDAAPVLARFGSVELPEMNHIEHWILTLCYNLAPASARRASA